MKNVKTNIKNTLFKFAIFLIAVTIISLGVIQVFDRAGKLSLTNKAKAVEVFDTSYIIASVNVIRKEQPILTPEEKYIKAYGGDKGFKKYIDTMNVRRNNPGNLVYAEQPGATKQGRFANFNTPHDGFRALIMQLTADMDRGDSLETFIYEYAPDYENDTAKYLNFLEKYCGNRNLSLKDIDILLLATKITEFEHGYKFN